MKLRVIGSSSKGNSYLLEANNEILILECGVPFKEIRQALGFYFSKVCGCIVSHEHNDHSKAAKEIANAGIDVYCSSGTADAIKITGHRLNRISALKQFNVGSFTILPFKTEHDCAEPLGFLIVHQVTGEKLVFATDTFYVRHLFNKPNYIMVECNYCLDILNANVEAGIVAEALKNRLIQSHFSLDNVKEFLKANVTSDTRKVILMHLSDDNSDAARMKREIEELTGIDTVVADAGMEIEMELFPF